MTTSNNQDIDSFAILKIEDDIDEICRPLEHLLSSNKTSWNYKELADSFCKKVLPFLKIGSPNKLC